MKAGLRRMVWKRAEGRCEYCLIHEDFDDVSHHLDHIIARKHGGRTIKSNLAVACASCSLGKGSNIAAIDPRSHTLTRLFHPRTDRWAEHFLWSGARLHGKTTIGRATIAALNINHPNRVGLRFMLIATGVASFKNT